MSFVREARIAGDDEEPADAGKGGDDLLDHAVDEIFLLGIAAHIGEGQHRDRRFLGEGRRRRLGSPHLRATRASLLRLRGRVREGAFRSDPIHPDQTRDILERLLAQIIEGEVEAADILLNAGRDADATGLGQAFEASRDVDAVAEDVALFDDDVALVYADAELDATFRGQRGVTFGQGCLDFGPTSQSVDDADELDEQAVAGGFYDAAAVDGDLRIDHFGTECLEAAERAFLASSRRYRPQGSLQADVLRELAQRAPWRLLGGGLSYHQSSGAH